MKIQKYVSEQLQNLSKELNSSENLLITAPTDSGKTYAIIEYAQQNPSKRIAFLMPTQALVNNLGENYPIKHGFGKEWVQTCKPYNFICTTYDTFQFFPPDRFDMIIIDEAHLLAGHGNFRTEAIVPLLEAKCKRVLLTGTPEIIENLEGYKRIDIEKNVPKKRVKIIQNSVHSKTHAFNLIQERDPKKLLIIRINNKDLLDDIYHAYRSINIYKLYSDSKQVLTADQDNETIEQIQRGIIPDYVEVLLCTSILDAGISLKVYKDVDCYAISDYNMPNAVDITQLYARVRTDSRHEMQLTIMGRYGQFGLDTDPLPIRAPRTAQLIKRMNERYNEFSELDQESYTNLLYGYNIISDEYALPEYQIHSAEHISKVTDFQIVSNFQSFPEQYIPLKTKLEAMGKYDELELITGTEYFNSAINTRVIRITEKMNFATDHDIHFSLFLTDTNFYQKRLDNYIGAVDSFASSPNFRSFMIELLQGIDTEGYKLNLEPFQDLSEPQQHYINEVSKLLYNRIQWNNKTAKLKRINQSEAVGAYTRNFTYVFMNKTA